jgi:hypothetical protein
MEEFDARRRIIYGDQESEYGGATFLPVCTICGRFVKADEIIRFTITPCGWVGNVDPVEPNAQCSKCGRVAMLFEGFNTCAQ